MPVGAESPLQVPYTGGEMGRTKEPSGHRQTKRCIVCSRPEPNTEGGQKSGDPPSPNLTFFLIGQKAALDWLKSLPEYQNFILAIKSLSDLDPTPINVPNDQLTRYLFGLLDQRIHAILTNSDRYSKWKDEFGTPPNHHKFFLNFIFAIHSLVQSPILYLVKVWKIEKALEILWKILRPEMARYRRMLQQAKMDPILNHSASTKDVHSSFYEGVLSTLSSCAPTVREVSRGRIKAGISKPIKSPPHKQEVFDKALVHLVHYLRNRIPDPEKGS